MLIETDCETAIREITEIIREIVKSSENIARPENFFYRSDKNSLDSIS